MRYFFFALLLHILCTTIPSTYAEVLKSNVTKTASITDNRSYAVNSLTPWNKVITSISSSTTSADDPSDDDFQSFESDTIINAPQLKDRFERFNKGMFKLNKSLQYRILNPTARFYKKSIPSFTLRRWVLNFFKNLAEPNDAINALLQLNFRGFLISCSRFLLNSTVGILGINDFATDNGIRPISVSFGETLAFYKIPPGPYLVIPIIGPSTVRECIGTIIDWFRNPIDFILVKDGRTNLSYTHLGASLLVNYAESALDLSNQIEAISIDEYSMVRSIYSQYIAKRKTLKQLIDESIQ